MVQPPAAPVASQVIPKEMVFVIDQTGSQAGWPIAKAKETMLSCLRRLNPGDTFQLIGFNTEVYPCFGEPVPATAGNIEKAEQFLQPLEGDGGTDILKSVDYALSLPDDPERLRIVCYMTDGYVGDDMQILDYIRRHRGRARMFPFGIGNAVNRLLVDGMAREGRGAAEYVTLESDGTEAADRFYRRIASPVLVDAGVDWNGLPVTDVYPRPLPDLFSGGPLILKGRYTRAAEGDITVHGLVRGRPWRQTMHVKLPATRAEGSAIPTLWARERIEDLQSRDWIGAQSGQPDPKIQEAIVQIALQYRLMSEWTSFVAVEQKVTNRHAPAVRTEVPAELPEGTFGSEIGGESGHVVHGAQFGWSDGHTRWQHAQPVSSRAPSPQLQVTNTDNPLSSVLQNAQPDHPPANLWGANQVQDYDEYGTGRGYAVGGSPQQHVEPSSGESRTGAPVPAAAVMAPSRVAVVPAMGGGTIDHLKAIPGLALTPPGGGGDYSGAMKAQALPQPAAAIPPAQIYAAKMHASYRPRGAATSSARAPLASFGRRWKPRLAVSPTPSAKLSPALRRLVASRAAGGRVGRVRIEIRVDSLPPDGLRRLAALGFRRAGRQTAGVLRGTAPVARLTEIAALAFVRRLEMARSGPPVS